MPQRTRQHQIEDISRRKFSLVIPSNWIFRDKTIDYGIDGEVEIFDNNNKATGLVFWVQLKATDAVSQYNILNVDLKIKTLQYYKKIDIPVLIVRYSVKNDVFFIKWSNRVDLFYAKQDAKTIKVKFNTLEKWDTNSYKKIILYLNKFRYFRNGSFQLPIDININIKENQIIDFQKGLLISRLRIEFKKYSDIVCFNSESDKALFEISISNELLIIETPGSTGCVFHDVQKRDKETFIENLVLDIIIGIAMSLTSYGHFGFSNRILFFKKEILLKLLKSEESFNYLFNQIINSTFFVTFMKLIINFVRKKDISDEFIFIVQSSLILSTKTHTSKEYSLIEQFLLLLHQKALVSKDNEYIGSTLYNLGSHYRVREQYKKGAIYYIKAKRFCPRYLKQDYFFKELGGIFWFLKKYKVSAHCYKLGLEISFNINNLPLYADALMFAGEYEKSVEVFDKYFSEYNDIRSEWILKYTFLINIIHDYGYKNQNRIQFTLSKKINNILELEKELSRDALNPQIWRKLGLLYKEESEIDKAFFAFIFCALAQNHDIESWINATMCSFSPDIPIELLCHTVITAYFFNKDYYLENIYRIILESNEPKAYEMIDLIETLIKKVDKPKRIPQLRFPNKDGLYEDIVKDFLKDGL